MEIKKSTLRNYEIISIIDGIPLEAGPLEQGSTVDQKIVVMALLIADLHLMRNYSKLLFILSLSHGLT